MAPDSWLKSKGSMISERHGMEACSGKGGCRWSGQSWMIRIKADAQCGTGGAWGEDRHREEEKQAQESEESQGWRSDVISGLKYSAEKSRPYRAVGSGQGYTCRSWSS